MSVPDVLVRRLKGTHPLLAFSGGVDSTYLLYACGQSGADAVPIFLRTGFQKESQLEGAMGIGKELGYDVRVVEDDVFSYPEVVANTDDRCYLCKRRMFGKLKELADGLGCDCVIDGTNASDDPSGRPGMRALDELGVLSPLRECGLTKDNIRGLSKEAGLPTWDMPSDSCLATRIQAGTLITKELLERTEKAESILSEFGFVDFRIRTKDSGAVLEVRSEQQEILEGHKEEIGNRLSQLYDTISYGIRRSS